MGGVVGGILVKHRPFVSGDFWGELRVEVLFGCCNRVQDCTVRAIEAGFERVSGECDTGSSRGLYVGLSRSSGGRVVLAGRKSGCV